VDTAERTYWPERAAHGTSENNNGKRRCFASGLRDSRRGYWREMGCGGGRYAWREGVESMPARCSILGRRLGHARKYPEEKGQGHMRFPLRPSMARGGWWRGGPSIGAHFKSGACNRPSRVLERESLGPARAAEMAW
jgi:hypothetical protein